MKLGLRAHDILAALETDAGALRAQIAAGAEIADEEARALTERLERSGRNIRQVVELEIAKRRAQLEGEI